MTLAARSSERAAGGTPPTTDEDMMTYTLKSNDGRYLTNDTRTGAYLTANKALAYTFITEPEAKRAASTFGSMIGEKLTVVPDVVMAGDSPHIREDARAALRADRAPQTDARTVSLSFKLSDQFLKDVLVEIAEITAPNYSWWGRVRRTNGTSDNYTEVEITYEDPNQDEEGEHGGRKVIGLDEVAEGIRKLLAPTFKVNSTIRGYVLSAIREDDAGHIDAEAADCITQALIFGELVYS